MGEVSWEEINKRSEGQSGFVKFPEGTTTVRLLSPIYDRWTHRVKIGEDYKNLPVESDKKLNGKTPQCTYVAVVIDRTDGQIKIMEKGVSIFQQISTLAGDSDYGDPRNYDIKITRKGTTMQDTKYTVIASPKQSEITEQEKADYDNFMAKFDLVKYCRPLTDEELFERLGYDPEPAQNDDEPATDQEEKEDKKPITSPTHTDSVNLDDIPF